MDSISHFFHTMLSTEGIRELITSGGYIALFIIIFSETGLLVGFFLPGDSLLVTAGLLIATHVVALNIVVLDTLLILAAIMGDATGFWLGKSAGQRLYSRPNSRFFKKEHLIKTQHFYNKYGGKTIVLARFIPVIRTFAPVVAGAANMTYAKFAIFNIFGGALWILVMTSVGYLLATVIPNVDHYLHYIIAIVIFLSILPPIIEWLRNRKQKPAEGTTTP